MITENKRKQITFNNTSKNTGRILHTYNKRDRVLQLKPRIKRKHSKHKSDPYKITELHANVTVTISQGTRH